MLPARGGAVRLATGAGLIINTTTGMRLLTSALSVSSEQNLQAQATPVIKEKVGMIFGPDIADVKNIIQCIIYILTVDTSQIYKYKWFVGQQSV